MTMPWINIADALGITEESCVEERVCRETYEEYNSLTNNFQRFMFLWRNRRNHYMNDTLPLEIYDFIWWWDQFYIFDEIEYKWYDLKNWFKRLV